MRKADAAHERNATSVAGRRDRASHELVCLALVLAIAVVLWRIAGTW